MELEKKIEAYLSGEMTGEELEAFQEVLDNDPEVLKEVRAFQDTDAFLGERDWPDASDATARQSYLKALESLQAKQIPEKIDQVLNEKSSSPFPYWRAIAASFAVIVVSFAWFYLQPAPTGPELFHEFYNMKELPSSTVRGTASEEEIVALYEQGDFALLIAKMEAYSDEKPELMLYYGAALLATHSEEKAIAVFQEFVGTPLLDAPRGYWYMGLAYLKIGDKAMALEALKKLKQSGSKFKQQEMLELIDELD